MNAILIMPPKFLAVFSKREKNWDMTEWAEFPKGPVGFSACKVLQTGLHIPAGSMGEPDVEELKRARETARPAHLRPFVRMEWKVLSRNAAQTDCEIYEQEGF